MRDKDDPMQRRRRRARAERGPGGAWPSKKEKFSFEDYPQAERELAIMNSLEDGSNSNK